MFLSLADLVNLISAIGTAFGKVIVLSVSRLGIEVLSVPAVYLADVTYFGLVDLNVLLLLRSICTP